MHEIIAEWSKMANISLRLSKTKTQNKKKRFIVLSTGAYLTEGKALLHVKKIGSGYPTPYIPEMAAENVLNMIPPVTIKELNLLPMGLSSIPFFNWYFTRQFGARIRCIDLYESYCKVHKKVTLKRFYMELGNWLKEYGYIPTFKNVRRNKIIIIRKHETTTD